MFSERQQNVATFFSIKVEWLFRNAQWWTTVYNKFSSYFDFISYNTCTTR